MIVAVVLWLYENDKLSLAELADVLNVPISVIRYRLSRGRQLFIEAFQDYTNGGTSYI